MYRVLAIVAASLFLSACADLSTPSWMKPNWDFFKSSPSMETVRFESEPPGAEAKTSTGQNCRTPCALAVPGNAGFSVTFTLTGYLPDSETVELVSQGDGTSALRPNPVVVELSPAPPPPKPQVKPAPAKKKPAPKPVVRRAPAAAPAPAPAAAAPAADPQSPWPAAPTPR